MQLTGLLYILLSAFYFVSFTDKVGSEYIALSETALERRAKYNIPIDDLDWAVSAEYLDSIRRAGGKVAHTTRWINGATVEMDETLAEAVRHWSFVKSVELTRPLDDPTLQPSRKARWLSTIPALSDEETLHPSEQQLGVYNLLPLHESGYTGQGIVVSVIDAGFPAIDTAESYSLLRNESRLLGMYDYAHYTRAINDPVANHGTSCLSALTAQTADYHPSAPGASYYLMRTEEWDTEYPKEADNWIAAVECCDSLGVDIVSTSLGYCMFDDPSLNISYESLDGKTHRSSRAALIAARKGMLVCVAAGNFGNDENWPYIDTPGDADSILTVGAIDVDSVRANFSSIGPVADGRIKPEVVAVGKHTCVVNTVDGKVRFANGTSFACPLIAGLAASLWSALPEASAMEIRERIIRSAHQYDNPDNLIGYGIPNAQIALEMDIPSANPSIETDHRSPSSAAKIIHSGNLYVLRDGGVYDLFGRRMY